MFDIGASELLVIAIIAVIVIGPKELPLALRTAGKWIAKIRRVSSHFRTGLDAMVREAEMEEMDRKWKEQNEAIMQKYPASAGAVLDASSDAPGDEMMPLDTSGTVPLAESAAEKPDVPSAARTESEDEPSLPLESPKKAD